MTKYLLLYLITDKTRVSSDSIFLQFLIAFQNELQKSSKPFFIFSWLIFYALIYHGSYDKIYSLLK